MKFHMFHYQFIRNQIRLMSSIKPKDHYNSLGIAPTSTQGEVKSAYYKLSMIHHPDKNQDANEESARKFRDITEAYEVLGNLKTRKLYDKGLYFRSAPIVTDENVNRFHKSRERRSRPPPPSGRTPIYDFDEWSKSHYGATFRRQVENRQQARIYRMERQVEKNSKTENVFLICLGLILFSTLIMKEPQYDKVSMNNKPPKHSKKSDDLI